MSEKNKFEHEIQIKRDSIGWIIPKEVTTEASKFLRDVVNSFGHHIPIETSITPKELAKEIEKNYDDDKARDVAVKLRSVMAMSLVLFKSDKIDSNEVANKIIVVGVDFQNTENEIDSLSSSRMFKNLISKQNNDVRVSVYTGDGGELKSTIIDKPKLSNKKPTI